MGVDDIPLLHMIKGRLSWLNARERVIAQNVANADTPGFKPRDLKAFEANTAKGLAPGQSVGVAAVRLAVTQPGHMGGGAGAPVRVDEAQTQAAPDSETRMDGNSVVLEEQMLKMAESRMAYDAAISLYQKSMNMLRMASRAPGR